MAGTRTEFSGDDDLLLMKYIARYNPDTSGRQGNALYQRLKANADGKWKWAARHPWQSWRERYKNNRSEFDEQIEKYQKKKGIKSENPKQKVALRKKAARRRHAVDEGQSEQEVDQLQKSDSDRERGEEKKRKRKRVEEKEDRQRKRAKEEEEEEEDASMEADVVEIVSGDEVQKRTQDKTAIRRSSPDQHDEDSDEEDDESGEEKKGPAGPDDYSAELFVAAEDDEIMEDSENVGADEDQDMSQDDTADDEEVDDTVIAHVKHQGSASPEKDTVSQSRQASASPRKSIAPMRTTPRGNGPLYPDLSVLPSPVISNPQNDESQFPGAFDAPIKHEPLSQDKIAPNASPQNSHPSQEPTPPLSNADVRSPRPEISENAVANERSVESQGQASRKSVFPGGNYKADLPARTNTLVLQRSPSTEDADVPGSPNTIVPTKSKLKLKRRRSSGNEESDFFMSIPPTPAHNDGVRMAREPPKLVEGPFGSAFTDGRGKAQKGPKGPNSSEDEEDEDDVEGSTRDDRQEWPPRRTSTKQIDTKGNGKTKDSALSEASPTAGPSSHRVTSKSQGDHHPFTQPIQEYETVMAQYFAQDRKYAATSSSEVPHRTHHPFSQPSQAVDKHNFTTGLRSNPSHSPMQPRKSHRTFVEGLPDPSRISVSAIHATTAGSKAKRNYVPLSRVAVEASAGAPLSHRLTSSRVESSRPLDDSPLAGDEKTFKFPLPRESSREPSSDPFLVPEVPRQKHEKAEAAVGDKDRRKTFGGFGANPLIPKIDLTLRTKRPHRRIFLPTRQSLPALPSATGTEADIASGGVSDHSVPSSASSSPSNMTTIDHSIAVRLGVDTMLQRMSDNHGFTLDVVRRLYNSIGGFQRTDAVLKKMRESAEAEAISFISTDIDQLDRHMPTSRQSSPRRVSNRFSGPQFTPAPVDSGSMSDYSPPETSRAGQYAKLARQGRRHEALRQEARTVSLGGTADFLRNIRLSEGSSSRATSGAPAENMEGRAPGAALPVDRAHSKDVASSPPQEPIWKEQEEIDKVLLSGDPEALKELQEKMGGPSFKRRTADLMRLYKNGR